MSWLYAAEFLAARQAYETARKALNRVAVEFLPLLETNNAPMVLVEHDRAVIVEIQQTDSNDYWDYEDWESRAADFISVREGSVKPNIEKHASGYVKAA